MTSTNSNIYIVIRECLVCKYKDEIEISKREAAFELVDINVVNGETCKKCSSSKFSFSYPIPYLDYELIKEWATNIELNLMSQDEELLLADEHYLDSIFNILDTVSIPDSKRNLLMYALCIIVYDNSMIDEPKQNIELKNRVINELNKRQDKLKLADDSIMDYVKDVVYPQLQFNKDT